MTLGAPALGSGFLAQLSGRWQVEDLGAEDALAVV
jgi:hypothetical protein